MYFFPGAVANGRAKFEAQDKPSSPSGATAAAASPPSAATKISPEKPMRFFGSRSRTGSPMLPVKTPKVPQSKDKKSNAAAADTDKKSDKKEFATPPIHSIAQQSAASAASKDAKDNENDTNTSSTSKISKKMDGKKSAKKFAKMKK